MPLSPTATQGEAMRPAPVITINAEGRSPFVLVCDHASNRIPAQFGDLGLGAIERLMHIAWDPGALSVARRLGDMLDAPLVQSTVCRLVVDCNRAPDAPDLMPERSEAILIPGNAGLSEADRKQRVAAYHAPFHAAIEGLLDAREASGRETILVTLHTFTPVFHGQPRPWQIGLIHGRETGFTARLRDALAEDAPNLMIGWNEPYAGLRGVTYTLETHGDGRGLASTMIELRHDEVLDRTGVAAWAGRLARCLEAARLAG
ncbi:N-formylglutamate amidohydrolase [Arsenicitalea aurantiaca]|uniref:N-formylglutamate amidohydrolase n=1 Tax=Arsenicitalea aurantiaca TaxID=1783274 RepID=A0A433XB70_9HYPH|nr:N-formylglutamate amidohydrolase [Arsenicitalea aurantiaca]RUT31337.1 N-formylglutamate amidohydrolase [Arsenicitalea aurantiaca]